MTTFIPKIIQIDGADSTLPVLVVTTSFSERSSRATTQVVIDNYISIPYLNQKYKMIIIIECYPTSFKDRAAAAYNAAQLSQSEDPHPEDINYQILALEVIDWLFTLNLDRIHLLGKCAGASLAQFIVQESKDLNSNKVFIHCQGKTISIGKLILTVPASRTPELLLDYHIPLICAWQMNDPQVFTWGPISEDLERYAKIFKNKTNVTLVTFPGDQHEIPVEVFLLL
jgi:hypothetical protein